LYPMGRAFLVKCLGPLGGPDSETLMREARRSRSRILLIDTTHAEYADSDGLRWLMALREAAAENTLELRIVVREGSNIYRNLLLLRAGLLLYGSVQTALHNAPHTLSPPVLPARKEAAFVG
jgi:hypothetical protein